MMVDGKKQFLKKLCFVLAKGILCNKGDVRRISESSIMSVC